MVGFGRSTLLATPVPAASVHMEASDDDVHDGSSSDGMVARCFFQTDSDDDDIDSFRVSPSVHHEEEPPLSHTYTERSVIDIVVAERQFGASISEKLWPAAQHLAQFVMDVRKASNEMLLSRDKRQDETSSKKRAKEALRKLLQRSALSPLRVLELGAGVGLTGLQLATQFHCQVVVTDLPVAIPLLERNIILNQSKFVGGTDSVKCQVLAWGDQEDADRCVQEDDKAPDNKNPILVLASDCVYWSDLHLPLEHTLARLLSKAPEGSLCLIAGGRRWKKDTKFYNKLGKATFTATHRLVTTLLQETVMRNKDGRNIMRVYSVEWLRRHDKNVAGVSDC